MASSSDNSSAENVYIPALTPQSVLSYEDRDDEMEASAEAYRKLVAQSEEERDVRLKFEAERPMGNCSLVRERCFFLNRAWMDWTHRWSVGSTTVWKNAHAHPWILSSTGSRLTVDVRVLEKFDERCIAYILTTIGDIKMSARVAGYRVEEKTKIGKNFEVVKLPYHFIIWASEQYDPCCSKRPTTLSLGI